MNKAVSRHYYACCVYHLTFSLELCLRWGDKNPKIWDRIRYTCGLALVLVVVLSPRAL
jgi:hypothetical protein